MGCSRIEDVTRQARAAAEQGRWDLVQQLYGERETELVAASLSGEERLLIMGLDRQVAEQAMVARQAVAALLEEAAMQRQRIEEVRRRIGAMAIDTGAVFLQA